MNEYYDGTKLLSLKDINGLDPEIYISTVNRTAGKTTYFNRLLINSFLKKHWKFGLEVRFGYDADCSADEIFKDVQSLFFSGYNMIAKKRAKGVYSDLFIGAFDSEDYDSYQHCGYILPINNADGIKKRSHMFTDIEHMFMDEFQPESNKYCPDELNKFYSVHTSVARGQGKQTRRVPVYMAGNRITIINPYYTALGISDRLRENTNFLRGDGFVLENGFNESAANALGGSAFSRAFAGLERTKASYGSQSVYLNDNSSFIQPPEKVRSRYMCTIIYEGARYAIREYDSLGYLYCDTRVDDTFPTKLALTVGDHDINFVMLKRNDFFIAMLRDLFEKGAFRFQNLLCKQCVMQLVSYR